MGLFRELIFFFFFCVAPLIDQLWRRLTPWWLWVVAQSYDAWVGGYRWREQLAYVFVFYIDALRVCLGKKIVAC